MEQHMYLTRLESTKICVEKNYSPSLQQYFQSIKSLSIPYSTNCTDILLFLPLYHCDIIPLYFQTSGLNTFRTFYLLDDPEVIDPTNRLLASDVICITQEIILSQKHYKNKIYNSLERCYYFMNTYDDMKLLRSQVSIPSEKILWQDLAPVLRTEVAEGILRHYKVT